MVLAQEEARCPVESFFKRTMREEMMTKSTSLEAALSG
jgi:hypothetical protein